MKLFTISYVLSDILTNLCNGNRRNFKDFHLNFDNLNRDTTGEYIILRILRIYYFQKRKRGKECDKQSMVNILQNKIQHCKLSLQDGETLLM